jgi:hypothetical protein
MNSIICVEEIDMNQQRGDVKFDMSAKVIEQMQKDQQLMAKQMENTGNALAQLRIDVMRASENQPPSPADSENTFDNLFANTRPAPSGPSRPHHHEQHNGQGAGNRGSNRGFLPKMNFPRFNGKNRSIWKNKLKTISSC